jgi:Rod binding domain-containing protein
VEQKVAKLKDLRKSAEDYEGMLMAEMIKSMRQSAFADTPGSETYSEIAERPFTAAITAAGGLGLAETIVSQVAAQEGLDDVLAASPEVMGPNWRQRLSPSQMPKPGPRPAGTGRQAAAQESPDANPLAISQTGSQAGSQAGSQEIS